MTIQQPLLLTRLGNAYVTGTSQTCPGSDYLTLKYNSAGQEQWVARYYGPEEHFDSANAIAVDGSGNVVCDRRELRQLCDSQV